MSKPAPPSKFQAFTQKFVGGPKKRDVPPAPAPTGGPQIIKSPFDAFAAPPPNQGVAVPASIAMQSPAGTPGASASADATAGGATRAPGAAATSASGMGKRTSNMLNDLMGTFDELLVSKELEAVQEEAKASVYSESFKGSTDMIFDMDKGVARAKFAVGGKKHDDGNDDGTDDGASNADDVSSMKHSGSASSMAGIKAVKIARHLNIVEDLTTANPAVPTPYEERRSRRKKDMDENDLLTLAESVRLERSQRGAWLKEKLPGSPSSDSLQDISSVGTVSPISSGPASPLLGVVVPPANPAPVGPSPSDETTSEKGSLEEKEVRLAVSAAVKQVTESDLSPTSRRSPGVTVIASSPVEKFVPEIEPRPPGAEEQWMNDLIRENALENATLGMMSGGNDEEDDEADTPSTLTVAAKIKAFERAGGAVTTNRA